MLEPVWESVFIHDSFASRKGKGTHAAVDRLKAFIPKVTRNHTVKAWYAHLDIRSFFASIDHGRLIEHLARRAPSPTIQWLCERIVRRDIASDAILRGPKGLFDRVPPGKSLLRAPVGKSLPIGNHTSQFFANVYLNDLDQFVKHELRARYYIRYVDYLVLLSTRREELVAWKEAIARFLQEDLLLELNERRSRIAPLSSGVDFLGYIVHPHHALVRRRVVRNLTARLSRLEKALTEERGGYSWVLYRPGASEYLLAMVASYRAHFLRADTARLRSSIGERFPWLSEALGGPRGKPFWTGRRFFPCLGAQAHWLDARFPDALLAIQVGRFFEFYGRRAEGVARLARLKLIRGRRAGYRGWTRLPVGRLPYLLESARRAGIPRIVLAREAEAGERPRDPAHPGGRGEDPEKPKAWGSSRVESRSGPDTAACTEGRELLISPPLSGDLPGGSLFV